MLIARKGVSLLLIKMTEISENVLKEKCLYDKICKEINQTGIFNTLLSFYKSGTNPIMKDVSFIDQLDVSESIIHQKLDIEEEEYP